MGIASFLKLGFVANSAAGLSAQQHIVGQWNCPAQFHFGQPAESDWSEFGRSDIRIRQLAVENRGFDSWFGETGSEGVAMP